MSLAILWVIEKPLKPPTNPRKVSPQPVDSQLGALLEGGKASPSPILAGHIPADISSILRSHPVDAPPVSSESFGDSAYGDTTPHAPPDKENPR